MTDPTTPPPPEPPERPSGTPPSSTPPFGSTPPPSTPPPSAPPPSSTPPPSTPPPPPPPLSSGPPPAFDGPDQPDTSKNLFGILALVAGIVSIVLCCLYAGFWAGIPGIVLGVLGMRAANEGKASNKTMALIGLILSVVGVLIVLASLIFSSTVNVTELQHQIEQNK